MSKQDIPPQGKDGGAVRKTEEWWQYRNYAKNPFKPRVAGRLAMRDMARLLKIIYILYS